MGSLSPFLTFVIFVIFVAYIPSFLLHDPSWLKR